MAFRTPSRIAPALAALAWCGAAAAESAAYTPDILEFDGTRTITVAPREAFAVDGDETIEFWVAADWKSDPGYDPVVVSNAGEAGASYIIAILRDRGGVGVLSGVREIAAPFDFSDGRLHHVAIVHLDGEVYIAVEGTVVGASAHGLAALPSLGLWIGSADGKNAPFVGAIAQMRFWDAALDLETLDRFKLADVRSDAGSDHPYRADLLAVSDFPEPGMILRAQRPDDDAEGE